MTLSNANTFAETMKKLCNPIVEDEIKFDYSQLEFAFVTTDIFGPIAEKFLEIHGMPITDENIALLKEAFERVFYQTRNSYWVRPEERDRICFLASKLFYCLQKCRLESTALATELGAVIDELNDLHESEVPDPRYFKPGSRLPHWFYDALQHLRNVYKHITGDSTASMHRRRLEPGAKDKSRVSPAVKFIRDFYGVLNFEFSASQIETAWNTRPRSEAA